ncbi:MAG: glycosyltransferase family 2 protein [bacterium]
MNNLANKNKICAIIPFYNESNSISLVIEQIKPYVSLIIAVDDGSTDNSVKNIVLSDSIILLKHATNCGKGKAIKTGFEKALKLGFDFIFTIDGDLQHDPRFIPEFMNKIGKFDLLIGKRDFKAKKMPFARKLSNFFSSKILSILTKQNILDSQSGFRLFRSEVVRSINLNFDGFEAETEILINAAKMNYKIGFVDISTLYSDNDNSKIKNLNSIIGFIKVILYSFYGKYQKKVVNKEIK